MQSELFAAPAQKASTATLGSSGLDAGAVPAERVRGRISRIVFHNPESDFYIAAVTPLGEDAGGARRDVTIKGNGIGLAVGREIECQGVWEASTNPKYPERQFKAAVIQELLPASAEGIRKLLCSGYVPHVGRAIANALVDRFGAKLFDLCENSPDVLYTVPGVGDKRVDSLIRTVREKRALPRIMAFLAECGLGPETSHKVYKELGPGAVMLIKRDPYALTCVKGIGFARADLVARSMGVALDSPTRVRAGLEAVLQREAEAGSTAVAKVRLLELTARLLSCDVTESGTARRHDARPEDIAAPLEAVLAEGRRLVEREIMGGVPAVSLADMAARERAIAERIVRLRDSATASVAIDLASPRFAHLYNGQREAARTALASSVSVITGRPGCGKTTVIRSLVDALVDAGKRVLLVAPTGRAAKRITEQTGYAASTIHRALGSRGTGSFAYGPDNPLPFDAIVGDEWTMVDTWLMDKFTSAVAAGTKLIFVGDADQLASVGPGNVLADTIDSELVPVARLTKIRRQAEDSSIITNAHRIIGGIEPAETGRDDFRIVPVFDAAKQAPAVLEQFEALRATGIAARDIQVLTSLRQKGDLSVNALNRMIKQVINPGSEADSVTRGRYLPAADIDTRITYSVGDRVMQTANNKELGIHNGDIGYITAIDKKEGLVSVDFSGDPVELAYSDLDDLMLAYASTIHKSQGSEFKAVILPVARAHAHMLDRNLLYTAVTRARERIAVVGDTYMLARAVKNAGSSVRLTGLADELHIAHDAAKLRAEHGSGAVFGALRTLSGPGF